MITFKTIPTGEIGTLEKGVFKCPGYDGLLNAAAKNVRVPYCPVKDLGLFVAVREVCPFIELVDAPPPPEAVPGRVY